MRKNILLILLLAGSIFLFAPIDRAEASSLYVTNLVTGLCKSFTNNKYGSDEAIAWCGESCTGDCCHFEIGGGGCSKKFACYATGVALAKCDNVILTGEDMSGLTEAEINQAARNKCTASCPTGATCNISGNTCPVSWGCVKYGVCENVSEETFDKAMRTCLNRCGTPPNYNSAEFGACRAFGIPCPQTREYGCVLDGAPCKTIKAIDDKAAIAVCMSSCQQGKTCSYQIFNDCPAPVVEKPGPLAGATPEALKALANTNANKAKFGSPVDLINRAIKILMAFIGSISLVLYIWSGFLWMTASGNAEQVTKAKTTMVWTTLGVGMMLASYMLASFLFSAIAPK